MRLDKKAILLGAAAAAALVIPAVAAAHAVVSPFAPAGTALTGARTVYVLRVPNERADRNTVAFSMVVPDQVQTAISVLAMPGYSIKLKRVDTGAKTTEGAPIMATQAITWTPLKGLLVPPGFYAEVYFRFQNPITPSRLCFPVQQIYGGRLNARGVAQGKGEVVLWTGDASSATPASCVDVKAAA
ncbi:MAG TPA: DUF1775 domain-containing protein [Gaiellaceae bacterium]|nr:DUF1775 domain-containing protein [Gaiellaceae bacterium]